MKGEFKLKRNFTLIELVICVTIIFMIVMVVVPGPPSIVMNFAHVEAHYKDISRGTANVNQKRIFFDSYAALEKECKGTLATEEEREAKKKFEHLKSIYGECDVIRGVIIPKKQVEEKNNHVSIPKEKKQDTVIESKKEIQTEKYEYSIVSKKGSNMKYYIAVLRDGVEVWKCSSRSEAVKLIPLLRIKE
jgi:hypothetical protein